jgi:hypothetical protein
LSLTYLWSILILWWIRLLLGNRQVNRRLKKILMRMIVILLVELVEATLLLNLRKQVLKELRHRSQIIFRFKNWPLLHHLKKGKLPSLVSRCLTNQLRSSKKRRTLLIHSCNNPFKADMLSKEKRLTWPQNGHSKITMPNHRKDRPLE